MSVARSATGRATMASALIGRAGEVQLRQVPLPQPSSGQVRVRLQGCGVCGSDLPVWEGRPWFDYPREAGSPGHEGWGHVDAIGRDITDLAVGDRVAALGVRSYAEYDLVAAEHAVVLDPELDDEPFPGEALGCAINAFERAQVTPGAVVAVVGVGFLGALLVGLAADASARVIAISRRATAREMAVRMGARDVLELDASVAERVRELTGGALCDVVIEAAGVQTTLDVSAALTRVRGRLVIAGYHQDGPRQVDMQQWNWRGIDVINAHERDPARYVAGMRAAVDAVVRGQLDPRPLYTHRFALAELGWAFATMRERPEGFVKALVTM